MSNEETSGSSGFEKDLSEVMSYRGHGVFVLTEATRFEIYPSQGKPSRVVTLEAGATLHLQDSGRTVKIFTRGAAADPHDWYKEKHDWGKRGMV